MSNFSISNNRQWYDIVQDGNGGQSNRVQSSIAPFVSVNTSIDGNNRKVLSVFYYDEVSGYIRRSFDRSPDMEFQNLDPIQGLTNLVGFTESYNYSNNHYYYTDSNNLYSSLNNLPLTTFSTNITNVKLKKYISSTNAYIVLSVGSNLFSISGDNTIIYTQLANDYDGRDFYPYIDDKSQITYLAYTTATGVQIITPQVTNAVVTTYGTIVYTSAKLGNSAIFTNTVGDAATNYILIGCKQISPLSVSFWFNTTDGSSNQNVLSIVDSNLISILTINFHNPYNGNGVVFNFNGANIVSNNQIPANTWFHFCFTIDASYNMILYINGTNVGSITSSASTSTPAYIYIGGTGNSSPSFNGYIDELNVFNRDISGSEVSTLYGLGSVSNGLVAHYAFDASISNLYTPTVTTINGNINGNINVTSTIKNNSGIFKNDNISGNGNITSATNYLTITNKINFPISTAFWFYPLDSANVQTIFSLGNKTNTQNSIEINLQSGVLSMNVEGNIVTSNVNIISNNWYSVFAAVFLQGNGSLHPLNQLMLNGNAVDVGSAASTVTTTGSFSYETYAGKSCLYVDTDGINKQISFPVSFDQSSSFTFSFWGNYTNINPWSVPIAIVGENTSLIIGYGGGQYLYGMQTVINGSLINYNYASVGGVTLNSWNNYTFTFQNGYLTAYLNGVLINSVPFTNSFSYSQFIIGGNDAYQNYLFGGQANWTGYIRQVCVFNSVLTSEQITTLYTDTQTENILEGNQASLYVNNISNTIPITSNVLTYTDQFTIGCNNNGLINGFNGYLDELFIFNNFNPINPAIFNSNTTIADNTGQILYIPFDTPVKITNPNPVNYNIVGEVSTTSSIVGNSAFFVNTLGENTPTNYIIVPNNNDLPISISFWFNTNNSTYYQTIIGLCDSSFSGNGIQFDYDSTTNQLKVFAAIPSMWTLIGNYSITINTWYHVVFTIDSSFNYVLYINSILNGTGTGTGNIPSKSLFIIGASGDKHRGFNGYIDEFIVYNRVINATEVLSLYNIRGVVGTSSNSLNAVSNGAIIYMPLDGNTKTSEFCVACGYGGQSGLAYSYDGINWRYGNNIFNSGQAYCVAYGNGMWVAVGQGTDNTIAYSLDGIKWIGCGPIINLAGLCVAWNSSYKMWIAGGDGITGGKNLVYSYDGINWTSVINELFVNAVISTISCNNNIWLAGGKYGNGSAMIIFSYDGINWNVSDVTSIFTTQVVSICSNGLIWVAGGIGSSSLAYSSDGINWTASANNLLSYGVFTVCWNGSIWVASGNGGNISTFVAYSTDGINWIGSSEQFADIGWPQSISWNGSMFVGITLFGYIVYSIDGNIWNKGNQGIKIFNTDGVCIASSIVLPIINPRLPNTLNITNGRMFGSVSYSGVNGGATLFVNPITQGVQPTNFITVSNEQNVPITISIWFNSNDGNNYQTILSFTESTFTEAYGSLIIDYDNSSKTIYIAIAIPTHWSISLNSVTNSVLPNTWNHVAITIDSNFNVVCYLNGISFGTGTGTGPIDKYSLIMLGGFPSYRGFNGYLNEFMVYNKVLNASQIYDLFKLKTIESGRIIYLPLNEPLSNSPTMVTTNYTTVGTVTYSSAVNRNSAYFNNVMGNSIAPTCYMTVPFTQPSPITISHWFNCTDVSQFNCPIAFIGLDNNSTLISQNFDIYNNNLVYPNGTFAITSKTWYHFCFSLNANIYKFYINGNLINSVNAGYTLASCTQIFIGGAADMGRGFNGYIDEVTAYNRVLTTNEINDLYNLKNVTNGRIIYLPFDAPYVAPLQPIVVGSVNYTTSIRGNSAYFNNTLGSGIPPTNYLMIPYTNSFPITISFWFNCNNVTTWQTPIGLTDDLNNYIMNFDIASGTISIYIITGGITGTSAPIEINKWYHICATIDSLDNQSFYVNGTLIGTSVGSLPLPSSTKFRIGGDSENTRGFNGSIDEFIVYNRVLNSNEVSLLANAKNVTDGVVIYAPLDKSHYPWSPKQIDGLQLWLDASDTSTFILGGSNPPMIGQWNDKSGNGYNATGIGGVTLNTNKVLFDGTTGYFTTNYTANLKIETIFIIVNFNDVSPSAEYDLISGSTSGDREYLLYSGSIASTRIADGSGFFLHNGGTPVANTTYLYGYSNNSTNINFYTNGSLISSTNGSYNLIGSGTTSIGAYSFSGGGGFLNGSISEIIIYNTILTNEQRQTVEVYLTKKWNLQNQLPQSYPTYTLQSNYTINPPLILLKAIDYSGSGDWLDQSGNGVNATLENGTIAKNTAGNGIVLDGSTCWTFPNISAGNAWTANVWWKNTGSPIGSESGADACILTQIYNSSGGSSLNISIGQASGNTLLSSFFVSGGSGWYNSSPYTFINNAWTNIQLTWDGSFLNLYVNSVLTSSNQYSTTSLDGGFNYRIGRRWDLEGYTDYMVGEIGEVRIYGYALNQLQVTADYNSSYNTFFPGPVILLKAIDYSGSGPWLDQSGNGNNATIVDGTIAKNSIGNGIVFNGSTYWQFPNVAVGNTWSVGIWYKQTQNQQGSGCLIAQSYNNNPINIMIQPSGNVGFFNNGTWIQSDSSVFNITNNVWTNIQITWDGTNIKSYINGILQTTRGLNGTTVDGGTYYRVGRRWDGTEYIYGEIGEIRIYNYVINKAKVLYDYNSSVDTYTFNPTTISNCRLWVDVSTLQYNNGETISSWNDLTTNSTLSQLSGFGSPTFNTGILNGLPMASFNTSQCLGVYPPFSGTKQSFFAVSRQAGGANGRVFGSYLSNQLIGYWGINGPYKKVLYIDNNPSILSGSGSDTNWDLISLTIDTSNGYNLLWNGTSTLNGGSTNAINSLTLNGFLSASIETSDCQIAEVIFYDNIILTSLQRQTVEGYLAWKWGLQSNLPTNHPFYNSAPNNNSFTPLIVLKAIDYSGSGDWLDQSGNGRNATLEEGTIAKNADGNGIVLDGSTCWTFPNVAVGNAWTVNIWYKNIGSIQASCCIITQIYNGYVNLSVSNLNNDSSQMVVGFIGTGTTGNSWGSNYYQGYNIASYLVQNKWVNIQGTWDGSNLSTYINGNLIGTITFSGGTSIDNGLAYRIGRKWDSAEYMTGEIGEVRIYNYALNQSQVTNDYLSSQSTYKFNPTIISGCQLWMDGADSSTIVLNGSNVTTWNDKSGNGYNTTNVVGTPTYSSGNGVVFNGSSYFSLPDGCIPFGNSSYSIYIVATFNIIPAGIMGGGASWNGSNNSSALNIRNESSGFINTYWYFNDIHTNDNIPLQQIFLYDSLYQSGGQRSVFLFGLSEGTDTPYSRNQPNTGNAIGYTTYNEYMNGTISEILVYNTNHSTYQRQVIEGYLSWKWSMQTQLPTNHPFYNNPPPINPFVPVLLLKAVNYSGSGSWNDESGNGRNATIESGTIAKNSTGNGIILNGSTSWTFPNVAVGNAWTINVWFKSTIPFSTTDTAYIIGQKLSNSSINIMIGNVGSNLICGSYNPTWLQSNNITLITNSWTNIQATWDGSTLTTYINGSSIGTVTMSYVCTDNGTEYRFGAGYNGTYITGEIGEIRIYNYALSQEKVTSDYNSSSINYFYNPSFIPNLFNWIDTSDITTLFTNISGTNQVQNLGDSVRCIVDKVGNANLTTSGTAPTYNPNLLNLKAGIDFSNGSGLVSASVTKSSNVTLFWVGTVCSNITNYGVLWGHYGTNLTDILLRKNSSGQMSWFTNNDNSGVALNISQNQPVIYWATMENGINMNFTMITNSGIYTNISTIETLSWTAGSAPIFIGLDSYSYMSEILYYQRVLNQTEINSMISYLGNKWGIKTVIPSAPIENSITQWLPNKESKLGVWLDMADYSSMYINSSTAVSNITDKVSGIPFTVQGTNADLTLTTSGISNIASLNFNNNSGDSVYMNGSYSLNNYGSLLFVANISNITNTNEAIVSWNSDLNIGFLNNTSGLVVYDGANNILANTEISIGNSTIVYCDWFGSNISLSTNGSNLIISSGGSTAFNPISITGLQSWFDANDISTISLNGSLVSQWNDKSTNALNITQSNSSLQPSYVSNGLNSKPALQFNAVQGSSYNYLSSGVTSIYNSITPIYYFAVLHIVSASSPLYPSPFSLQNRVVFYLQNNNGPWTYNGGSVASNPGISIPNDQDVLICLALDNSQQAIFVNGSLSNGSPVGFSFGSATGLNLMIGYSGYNANDGFNGYISETLIYNSSISTNDRQKVEGYLAWKWGINGNLPTGHPYYNNSPTSGSSIFTTQNTLTIGKDIHNVPMNFGELLVYSEVISKDARQKAEGYLASKWGLTGNLAADHPYANVIPTITNIEYPLINVPKSFNGLLVWLDGADPYGSGIGTEPSIGTSINKWYDKSGNNNNFTQPELIYTPTYGLDSSYNKNGILFNGTQFYNQEGLSFLDGLNKYTIISAYRFDGTTGNPSELYRNYNGDNTLWFRYWNGAINVVMGGLIGGNGNMSYGSTISNGSGISTIISDSTAATYLNGTKILTQYKGLTTESGNTLISIGSLNGVENMTGSIFEFLVFNYAMNDTERQVVESYLANKWGLGSKLPIIHQYYMVDNSNITKTGNVIYSGGAYGNFGGNSVIINNNTIGSFSTNYLTIPNQQNLPISINFWMNTNDVIPYQTVVGLSDTSFNTSGLNIDILGGQLIANICLTNISYPSINTPISANNWYNVGLNIDNNYNGTLYLNGINVGTANGGSGISNIANYSQFILGGPSDNSSRSYNGYIQNFKVYNRTLLDYEMNSLYNSVSVGDGLIINQPLGNVNISNITTVGNVITSGVSGGSALFVNTPGDNQSPTNYITIPNQQNTTIPVTASFWFNSINDSNYQSIISFTEPTLTPANVSLVVDYDTSNKRIVVSAALPTQWNQIFSLNDSVLPNIWYHIAFTIDSSYNFICYLNGINIGFIIGTGTIFPYSLFQLGGSGNFRGFNGYIENFLVYNRALLPSEISSLYNQVSVTKGLLINLPLTSDPSILTNNDSTSSIIGNIQNIGGIINNCVNFTNTVGTQNQYIKVPNSQNLPISISFWMNCTNTSNSQTVFGMGNTAMNYCSINFDINSGTMTITLSGTDNPTISYTILSNTWYHVCLTIDNTYTGILYVNGSYVGTNQSTDTTIIYNQQLVIGGKANGLDSGFNGYVDEFRIYNRVVKPNEILSLYQLQNISYGLITYLTFDLPNILISETGIIPINSPFPSQYQGDWSDSKPYALNDVVLYNNYYWINLALPGFIGGPPNSNWSILTNISGSTIFNNAASGTPTDTIVTSYNILCSISIGFWMYCNDVTQTQVPVSLTNSLNNYILEFSIKGDNSTINLNINGGLNNSGISIKSNSWIHVCGTIDLSNNQLFYVNGIQVDGGSGGTLTNYSQFRLGGNCENNKGFSGYLQNFVVYNRVLTGTEISSLYNFNPPSSGLIINLPLNQSKYGVLNTMNETVVGNPSYSAGQIGNAVNFTDGTSYITVPNTTNVPMTVSFWFNDTGYSNQGANANCILSGDTFNNGFLVFLEGPDGFFLYLAMSTVWTVSFTGISYNSGSWNHAAITIDSMYNVILYINGINIGTQTGSSNITNLTMFSFGSANSYSSYGSIDDFQLYNRSLLPIEVNNIYNIGLYGKSLTLNGLVTYLPFDNAPIEQQTIGTVNYSGVNGGSAFFNNPTSGVATDYLTITNSTTNVPVSIALWFNCTSYASVSQSLLSANQTTGGISIVSYPNGSLIVFCALSTTNIWTMVTLTSINLNTWYHLCITVDESFNIIVYLNGINSGTATGSANFTNFNLLYLGGDTSNYNSGFIGYIEEFMLYNRILSSGEVTTLYNVGTITSGRMIYLHLDNSNFSLYNIRQSLFGTGTNLVLNGSFETGDITNWIGYLPDHPDLPIGLVSDLGNNYGTLPISATYCIADGWTSIHRTFSQIINVVQGQSYTLSYYYAKDGGGATQYFAASLDGTTVIPGSEISVTGNETSVLQPWTFYTFDFIAQSSSINLTFIRQQDPGSYYLTGISIVANNSNVNPFNMNTLAILNTNQYSTPRIIVYNETLYLFVINSYDKYIYSTSIMEGGITTINERFKEATDFKASIVNGKLILTALNPYGKLNRMTISNNMIQNYNFIKTNKKVTSFDIVNMNDEEFIFYIGTDNFMHQVWNPSLFVDINSKFSITSLFIYNTTDGYSLYPSFDPTILDYCIQSNQVNNICNITIEINSATLYYSIYPGQCLHIYNNVTHYYVKLLPSNVTLGSSITKNSGYIPGYYVNCDTFGNGSQYYNVHSSDGVPVWIYRNTSDPNYINNPQPISLFLGMGKNRLITNLNTNNSPRTVIDVSTLEEDNYIPIRPDSRGNDITWDIHESLEIKNPMERRGNIIFFFYANGGFYIQEQNKNHELVWEFWSSDLINYQGGDYFHFNALDVHPINGNLVCSFRNCSTIACINYVTKNIDWAIDPTGGFAASLKNISLIKILTPTNEPNYQGHQYNGTSCQHDSRWYYNIKPLTAGHDIVAAYDDQSGTGWPARGVIYEIDLANNQAIHRGSAFHPGNASSGYMGSYKIQKEITGTFSHVVDYVQQHPCLYEFEDDGTGMPTSNILFSMDLPGDLYRISKARPIDLDIVEMRKTSCMPISTLLDVAQLWNSAAATNVTVNSLTSVTKTSGNSDYNAQIYSITSYIKPTFSIQLTSFTNVGVVGLSENPFADIGYANINYGWNFDLTGPSARIYELGSLISTPVSPITNVNSVYEINFDGTNVNYLVDGVNVRSVRRTSQNTLYCNLCIFGASLTISNIYFNNL